MKIKLLRVLTFFCFNFFFFSCTAQDEDDTDKIITQRITLNEGFNNAFTDLVFFDNHWFLTYRESDKHVLGKDGIVKILTSTDGQIWSLIKEFQVEGLDIRSGTFAVDKNKLMIYVHASKYIKGKLISFNDYKSSYKKGIGWQNLENVFLDKKKGYIAKIEGNQAWPWKFIWYKEKAYTFGYGLDGLFEFYKSTDGLQFTNTNSVQPIEGAATEAAMEVNNKGVFYALVRRDQGNAMIGKSSDIGESWDWFGQIPIYDFGGPDFIFYKNGILLSGRESHQTILSYYDFGTNNYKKIMTIKSAGDCSYPGMVVRDGFLWMSYYSGHENKSGTSIYISKINLEKLGI